MTTPIIPLSILSTHCEDMILSDQPNQEWRITSDKGDVVLALINKHGFSFQAMTKAEAARLGQALIHHANGCKL